MAPSVAKSAKGRTGPLKLIYDVIRIYGHTPGESERKKKKKKCQKKEK